ncbi:MAG: tetratricopeptide repeat protein, partial [Candidatus Obscuribacterales bacterium]|nr:tetratricopeptide repeat protein [Candidatus Obscuribacterales bacterium]
VKQWCQAASRLSEIRRNVFDDSRIKNMMPANFERPRAKSVLLLLTLSLFLKTPFAAAATKFEQFSSEAEAAYKNRNYPEAQKCFEQALKEADKLDKNDKRIATTIYNLALVFQAEGNYAEAESNMLKALDQMIYLYGAEHQRVAQVYMDLADLYVEEFGQENKPELKKKAAENYRKGIDIFEKIYAQSSGQEAGSSGESAPAGKDAGGKKGAQGKPDPQAAALDLANATRMLADFYAEDEIFNQAEPLYKRSLELEEYASGSDDKSLAKHKAKVAEFYCIQGKHKPAEPLFKEALAASEKSNGEDSIETGRILYNFGGLYYDQGSFGDAEVMFKRALKILEKDSEKNEQDLAQKSIALADVLDMEGKVEEAGSVYKKAITTLEKGEDKSVLIRGLKQYQKHYLMMNNKDEASKISARIKDLKAKGSAQQ